MNTRMYENPITQDNLKILEHYGMEVIRPASGYLACGDTGAGKMPEPETLYEYIIRSVGYPKDLTGKKILITAGLPEKQLIRSAISQITLLGKWVMPLQRRLLTEGRR